MTRHREEDPVVRALQWCALIAFGFLVGICAGGVVALLVRLAVE